MSTNSRKHPFTAASAGDSCGCAMSARFLGMTLIAGSIWFALRWPQYSFGRAGIRILMLAFASALLGKLIGVAAYRLRQK
jgi:hypothetical protein